jgi:putative acetyltransferase
MAITIQRFEPHYYPAARHLWEATEGVGLSAADSAEAIMAFLTRNPGLSFVALQDEQLVGTILVGHDGRRGLIHHLAVAAAARRQGIGAMLVREGLAALDRNGIQKCHLFVFADNTAAHAFWQAIGAEQRTSLVIYSLPTSAAS